MKVFPDVWITLFFGIVFSMLLIVVLLIMTVVLVLMTMMPVVFQRRIKRFLKARVHRPVKSLLEIPNDALMSPGAEATYLGGKS